MTRLETRPAEASARTTTALLAVTTVAAAVVSLAAGTLTSPPSLVGRVTIVNPTPYQVEVDVRGNGQDAALDLGSVSREVTRDIEDVLDHGGHWLFRFSHGGQEAGDLVFSRDDLERAGWRVTVPADVAERLANAGFQPSAR